MNALDTHEAARQIREVVEIASSLTLIIALVPDRVPESSLRSFAQEALQGRRLVLHRLDRDGSLLTRSPWNVVHGPFAILAWGLERLPDIQRAECLRGLNLARDSLRRVAAPILLVVPESAVEDFYLHCPDLFEWRDLLIRVAIPVMPLSKAVVLDAVMERAQARVIETALGVPIAEPEVGLRVRSESSPSGSLDFVSWVDDIRLGLLIGTMGSGKSSAIRALARTNVARLRAGERDATLTVWIDALTFFGVGPDPKCLGEATTPPFSPADWADVLVVIDDLENVPGPLRDGVWAWASSLIQAWPGRVRVLVLGRSPIAERPPKDWNVAATLPWSVEEARLWLGDRGVPEAVADRVAPRSPLFAAFLVAWWEQHRRAPADSMVLFEELLRLPTDPGLEDAVLSAWESGSSRLLAGSAAPHLPTLTLLMEVGLAEETPEGEWRWPWRSVASWLVARALVRAGDGVVKEAARVHAEEPSWQEALRMAIGRLLGRSRDATRIMELTALPHLAELDSDASAAGRLAVALDVGVAVRLPADALFTLVLSAVRVAEALRPPREWPADEPPPPPPPPALDALDSALSRARRALERATSTSVLRRSPGTMTPEARRYLSTTLRALHERLIGDLRSSMEREYRLSLPFCGPSWALLDDRDRANRGDALAWWRDQVSRGIPRWREQSGSMEAPALRRQRLEEWLYEQWRASEEWKADRARRTMDKPADLDVHRLVRERLLVQVAREAAYTLLNRVVILRILEVTGLRRERVLIGGWNSAVYKDFRQIAPVLCRDESEGYAYLLQLVFEELAVELPGLFGPVGLTGLVALPSSTLRHLIEALDDKLLASCWSDDTLLGWVYQYWNDPDRELLDKKLNDGGKLENHEIASKTQLFTERYMVEWLLQNSVGALWMAICLKNGWTAEVEADGTLRRLAERREAWRQRRDDSEVTPEALMPIETPAEDRWKYWVQQTLPSDFVEKAPDSLRAVKLLDPACGSGHFLVVAFEQLFWLYREEARQRGLEGASGWSDGEIVRSIVENNLFGLDLDPRAVQIAAAALWLKAERQLATGQERPEVYAIGRMNLVASALRLGALSDDDSALVELRAALVDEEKVDSGLVKDLVKALKGADHLGTLLKVDHTVEALVEEAVKTKAVGGGGGTQAGLFQPPERAQVRQSILDRIERFLGEHTSEADLGLRLRGEQLAAGVRYLRLLAPDQYDVVVGNPPYQGAQKLADDAYLRRHYDAGKADLYAAFLMRGVELARPGGLSALLTMRGWMFIQQFKDLRESLLTRQDLRSLGDVDRGAFEEIGGAVVAAVMSVFHRAVPSDVPSVAVRPTKPEDAAGVGITDRKRSGLLCQAETFGFSTAEVTKLPDAMLIYYWSKWRISEYLAAPKVAESCPARFGLNTGDNKRYIGWHWEARSPERWVPCAKGSDHEWIDPIDTTTNWWANGLEMKVMAEAMYGAYSRQIRNEDVYFTLGIAFSKIGASFAARAHRRPCVIESAASSIYPTDIPQFICSLNSRRSKITLSEMSPTVNFTVGDVNRLPLFDVDSADDIYAKLEAIFTEHEGSRETSVEFRQPGPSRWIDGKEWAEAAVNRADGEHLAEFRPLPRWDREAYDRMSFAVGVALGRFDEGGRGVVEPTAGGQDPGLPSGVLFVGPEDALDDSLGHPAARPIHRAWSRHADTLGSGGAVRDWLRTAFFSDDHRRRYENRPIYLPLSSERRTFVAFVSIHRWTQGTLRALLADWLHPTRARLEGELADLLRARQGADRTAARQAERRHDTVRKWKEELAAFIQNVEQCSEKGPPASGAKCPARERDARYDPHLDDGVMVNAAALWPLLTPQWKDPQKWWAELADDGAKNYDWSKLAARYFPGRVERRCVKDASVAVAHRCFWRVHPRDAWRWELRLQEEIGPDFRIDEPEAADARAAFIAREPAQALAIVVKEAERRRKKAGRAPKAFAMTWNEPGLWSALARSVWDEESELIKKWGEDFRLIDPGEPVARAALIVSVPRLAAARAELLREVRATARGMLFPAEPTGAGSEDADDS